MKINHPKLFWMTLAFTGLAVLGALQDPAYWLFVVAFFVGTLSCVWG